MAAVRVLIVTVVHVPLDARIFERQTAALRDAGCEVTYAAPWSATGTDEPGGLRTIDLPRSVGRTRWPSVRAAARLLREEAADHDIIIVHDPELLVAIALARPNVPMVWDVHEDVAASLVARDWVPRPARGFSARIVHLAERWAERRMHLILAERAYGARFSRRHPVVPNVPIVPPTVPPSRRGRVVYVGRVARVRGADELIELGRRLRGEVEVEVVGDAEADVADRLARAHQRGEITWRGFLPNDQALVRVQGATAGLSLLHDLPNFRGSMPTKVLEYLACGVPVVTTPLPLAARVVRDADAGEVVGFGDVGATERAIRRLNQDDRRREEAAQRGRELVRSRYSWETEAPRFVSHVRRWARPRISLPPLDDDPTVSVVIPAREAARTLERAVASALANGADEVVLAVAPSHDGTEVTARRISAADRRVHVVMNPCGRTPSALNAAIRTARGQIIARLDAHAEFPAGYLARALQLLRDTGASNVGGRQRPVTGSGFAAAVARAMTSPFGAGGAAYRTGAAPRAVDTVYLGVFRREALEAVGGFDERMTRNQDYELNVRLREAGGVVWFAPDLLVAYRPRDSVRGLARQYFEYGRWRRVTLKLHPRSLRSRQLAPPFVVLGLGVSTMASLAMASPWMAFGCWTAYLTGIVGAGVHASARLLQAPSTALALAVMHLSWGVGFLVGPPRHALAPSD